MTDLDADTEIEIHGAAKLRLCSTLKSDWLCFFFFPFLVFAWLSEFISTICMCCVCVFLPFVYVELFQCKLVGRFLSAFVFQTVRQVHLPRGVLGCVWEHYEWSGWTTTLGQGNHGDQTWMANGSRTQTDDTAWYSEIDRQTWLITLASNGSNGVWGACFAHLPVIQV